MSRDVVVGELIHQEACALRMPGAARAFKALGRQAREEKWSFEDYLHEVLSVEIQSRRGSAVQQRVRDARSPEGGRSTRSTSPPPTASAPRRSPSSREAVGSSAPTTCCSPGRSGPARRTWRSRSASRLRGSVVASRSRARRT